MTKRSVIFVFLIFYSFANLYCQSSFNKAYLIYLKDKNHTPYSIDQPLEFLSVRAIERRAKNQVPITVQDLPVDPNYVAQIKSTGAKVLFTSKWFNTVTVVVDTILKIDEIEKLSFVERTELTSGMFSTNNIDLSYSRLQSKNLQNEDFEYGLSYHQIDMLGGIPLHHSGFKGKDVIIAVIDAGFDNVDSMLAFKPLFDNHQIIATYDLITKNSYVYKFHSHGMSVLGTMGGQLYGKLMGTAPEASYILLRSEIGENEYLIEEDSWIAAAEYADSAGADVINSSLGYSQFDDPNLNHTYTDMDGETTRITIAADIISDKGVIVVTSAGNEGNDAWGYITAPADAKKVLTIGAVDAFGDYAKFSSRGPSSDGRVKPNIVALGLETVTASTKDSFIGFVSGTSLSSPLIAGMTACLVGAFPDMKATDIKDAIEKSAQFYAYPNDELGYGIPNYQLAFEFLKKKQENQIGSVEIIQLYPNPFSDYLELNLYTNVSSPVNISLFDNYGRLVYESTYNFDQNSFSKINLSFTEPLVNGIYHLSIISEGNVLRQKVLKL